MAGVALKAPKIVAEGVDEYLLESGNTITKEAYHRLWSPQRGKVDMKAYGNVGRQLPNPLKNKRTHRK